MADAMDWYHAFEWVSVVPLILIGLYIVGSIVGYIVGKIVSFIRDRISPEDVSQRDPRSDAANGDRLEQDRKRFWGDASDRYRYWHFNK